VVPIFLLVVSIFLVVILTVVVGTFLVPTVSFGFDLTFPTFRLLVVVVFVVAFGVFLDLP
jgi:hypothetical protein